MIVQKNTHAIILGGGITGLTLGYLLAKSGHKDVHIIEKSSLPGGLAASLPKNDLCFDYGSHRLHPAYYPDALDLINTVLPNELLERPRRGRVLLGGKFVPYPPSLKSVIQSLGFGKAIPLLFNYLQAQLLGKFNNKKPETFAESLTARLGSSLFHLVFEQYARKLWGLDPSQIATDAADHRVGSFSIVNTIRQFLKGTSDKIYLYPKRGIGSISEALASEFLKLGGHLYLDTSVNEINTEHGKISSLQVDGKHSITFEHPKKIISTIPLDKIVSLCSEQPASLQDTQFPLQWRGIRLVVLSVEEPCIYENETFYIPDSKYLIGRVSEVNKYSPYLNDVKGKRFLSCEVPCGIDDPAWKYSESEIIQKVCDELKSLDIVASSSLLCDAECFVLNVPYVYPVYKKGWKDRLRTLLSATDSIENLLLVGRTGLFLHCNIDHCMKMGMVTAQYLNDERLSLKDWQQMREQFFDYHVRA